MMGQFGDTTYTKVFVGGLAWETHKDTMKKYFDQFGDILEAVVIADKPTGRSKSYGFSYYNVYGGATAQFPMYGGGSGGLMTGVGAAFYLYLQFREGTGGGATAYSSTQRYGIQYPHQLFHFSSGNYPHHYGAPMSLAPTPTMALHLPHVSFQAS